ncbi:MAG: hypothetical protein ACYCXA_11135 [Actinomycetes bacterium]
MITSYAPGIITDEDLDRWLAGELLSDARHAWERAIHTAALRLDRAGLLTAETARVLRKTWRDMPVKIGGGV